SRTSYSSSRTISFHGGPLAYDEIAATSTSQAGMFRGTALALTHGEPGHVAVRIRHHPSAGRQRPRVNELAPLEGVRACPHDRYPHKQREQAQLQCREHGCQPRIHTDEHRNPRRDEGTAGEVSPAHVPWQPARHQRNGLFEIGEMGYAEGNQGQAVEHPRDAQTLVAGGETEALPVLVTG